jgi:hypothetical protein
VLVCACPQGVAPQTIKLEARSRVRVVVCACALMCARVSSLLAACHGAIVRASASVRACARHACVQACASVYVCVGRKEQEH